MAWSIEKWDGKSESAVRICELAKIFFPRSSSVAEGQELIFLQNACLGCEKSQFVLKEEGVIWGFAFLSIAPSNHVLQLIGGIHPAKRCRGFGTALLQQIVTSLSNYDGINSLVSRCFSYQSDSVHFFQQHHFFEIDRLIWSKRSVNEPLSISMNIQQKLKMFEQSTLRMVTGDVFEKIRDDWAKAWWSFTMETCRDIPSKIPFEEIPFEKWKVYLEPPMLNRKYSIVMLDGIEMVGLLNLGELDDAKININFTAVKSNYRRRGISMILKIKAFELAKGYGAEFITTQNHHLNPMLQINKKLGFIEDAIDLSFQKNLDQTDT